MRQEVWVPCGTYELDYSRGNTCFGSKGAPLPWEPEQLAALLVRHGATDLNFNGETLCCNMSYDAYNAANQEAWPLAERLEHTACGWSLLGEVEAL
jgi:hypothetical protein